MMLNARTDGKLTGNTFVKKVVCYRIQLQNVCQTRSIGVSEPCMFLFQFLSHPLLALCPTKKTRLK